MISLIVPCYNEQEVLPIFYKELVNVLYDMHCEYELLFVDDGSNDATVDMVKTFCEKDRYVKYLSFSRNFGKESAIYAGLCNAEGDYIVIMDADMQDPPIQLPVMWKILEEGGYDCVAMRRVDRKGEPLIRSWFSKMFYKLINKISDADIMDGARDFRMMRREMAEAIISMGEYNRFSKGIFGWVGFRTYWLSYDNVERAAGDTKWNLGGLFKYAVDGIINFSHVPLSISSWFGIGMTGCSFVMLIFIIVRKLLFGDAVAGWASIICAMVFIGGIQLFCLGIMGQYIAKMYMETKKGPIILLLKVI